jgi:hypothetical protein
MKNNKQLVEEQIIDNNEVYKSPGIPDTPSSSWNLSMHSIEIAAINLTKALDFLSQEQYVHSYRCWKNIYLIFCGRFSEEEKYNLRIIEASLGRAYSGFNNPEGFNMRTQEQLKLQREFGSTLYKYIESIQQLLRKYKLDIADKDMKYQLG